MLKIAKGKELSDLVVSVVNYWGTDGETLQSQRLAGVSVGTLVTSAFRSIGTVQALMLDP